MSRGREVLRTLGAGVRAEGPTLLGLAGLAAAIYGTGKISPAAAWILAGVAAIVASIIWARLEPPKSPGGQS